MTIRRWQLAAHRQNWFNLDVLQISKTSPQGEADFHLLLWHHDKRKKEVFQPIIQQAKLISFYSKLHAYYTTSLSTFYPKNNNITAHISDLGIWALDVVRIVRSLLVRSAQLLVHTGFLFGAPHTAVLLVGVLAEATVLPAHGAVVQCDCGQEKTNTKLYHENFFF